MELLVLSSVLLISGCHHAKERPRYALPVIKHVQQSSATLLSDVSSFNTFQGLWADESFLYFLGYDPVSACFLHVYERASGAPVEHLLSKGRGPDELLSITSSLYQDGRLQLFDAMGRRSCYLDLNFWKQNGACDLVDTFTGMENVGNYVLENEQISVAIWNRSFLEKPLVDHPRLQVLNHGNQEIEVYDEYPVSDRRKTWQMYNQPSVSVSPDNRKMVIAPKGTTGCIVEIFSLEPSIRLTATLSFLEPDFMTDGNTFSAGERLRGGIMSIASDMNGFFVALDGETRLKDQASPWFNKLIEFDWTGKALRQIDVDYSLNCLCLYDRTIYAVGRNEGFERFLVKFEL